MGAVLFHSYDFHCQDRSVLGYMIAGILSRKFEGNNIHKMHGAIFSSSEPKAHG